MALNSSDQEKLQFTHISDGSCNIPISSTCFQLLKPAFDEVNEHCSLDVLPILFEEASLPLASDCPFHGGQDRDVYSISVMPEGGNVNYKGASQLAILSVLEVPNPSENRMCLDAQLKCQNCMYVQNENSDAYSTCVVNMDIPKKNMKATESNEETVGNLRSEGVVTHPGKAFLQRQESFKIGGNFMQVLLNLGLTLLKLTSTEKSAIERVREMSNNRWRRYKRSSFYDSRTVVLTFSILSIFGTLVLIYLTLRVRQNGESNGDHA